MGVNMITVDFRAPLGKLSYPHIIQKFLEDCCQLMGMVPLVEPIIKIVSDANPGITGIQVITTSHISVHTFFKQRQAFVDVFSCKEFNGYHVLGLIETTFEPIDIKHQIVPRAEIQLFRHI